MDFTIDLSQNSGEQLWGDPEGFSTDMSMASSPASSLILNDIKDPYDIHKCTQLYDLLNIMS